MNRRLWWQCSHAHTGTLPGKLLNTVDQLGQWLANVERTHLKLYPLCPADLLRVAPKKELLDRDDVALEWRIEHAHAHLSYEERKNARIVLQ